MKVSIEYCQAWNYKPRASSLEQELRQEVGSGIDVELIAGSDGVFEIRVDGRLIFSKKQLGRFPEDGEIVCLVR